MLRIEEMKVTLEGMKLAKDSKKETKKEPVKKGRKPKTDATK